MRLNSISSSKVSRTFDVQLFWTMKIECEFSEKHTYTQIQTETFRSAIIDRFHCFVVNLLDHRWQLFLNLCYPNPTNNQDKV